MDWYAITEKYHEQTFVHDCRLDSLPNEWQRELAAIWRLEADVNNGAYLQFIINWGAECHHYAVQALRNIRAKKMCKIINKCHRILTKHANIDEMTQDQLNTLLPNSVIHMDGTITENKAGSPIPKSARNRIYKLSYKFMKYPDDIEALGLKHYAKYLP